MMTSWEIETKEPLDYLKIKEFDVTWAMTPEEALSKYNIKFGYRTDGNFHYLDKLPAENIIDKSVQVLYKYNQNWFRCDNFTKNHNGLHILYSGCSNTEGYGANIENTWPHMLHSHLSNFNTISGYFNLGKGGNGLHKILNSFIAYIKEYGKPDYFFVLAPSVLRVWEWEDGFWKYKTKPLYATYEDKIKELILDHRKEFPNWLTLMNALEAICNTNDIKFLWTTWDNNETINIIQTELFNNSFFPLPPRYDFIVEKYRPGLKMNKGDLRARDGHPGKVVHEIWSDYFIKEIKKRGWLNV